MNNTPVATEEKLSKGLLLAILLAIFVVPMSISGTAVALRPISNELGTSPFALQWVVNGFNAAFAISSLAWGPLSCELAR